jgi:hypothetical protein
MRDLPDSIIPIAYTKRSKKTTRYFGKHKDTDGEIPIYADKVNQTTGS